MRRTPPMVRPNDAHATKLTPPEVARRWRISPEKVIAWIRKGELPAIDVSSRPGVRRPRYRIDPADLGQFEQTRRVLPLAKSQRRNRNTGNVTDYF